MLKQPQVLAPLNLIPSLVHELQTNIAASTAALQMLQNPLLEEDRKAFISMALKSNEQSQIIISMIHDYSLCLDSSLELLEGD